MLVWLEKEDLDRAIADFTKAIEIDPDNATVYNNRGFALRIKSRMVMVAAVDDFTKAVEISPPYAAAYNNRGYALKELGDTYNAQKDFNEARHLDPSLRIE